MNIWTLFTLPSVRCTYSDKSAIIGGYQLIPSALNHPGRKRKITKFTIIWTGNLRCQDNDFFSVNEIFDAQKVICSSNENIFQFFLLEMEVPTIWWKKKHWPIWTACWRNYFFYRNKSFHQNNLAHNDENRPKKKVREKYITPWTLCF